MPHARASLTLVQDGPLAALDTVVVIEISSGGNPPSRPPPQSRRVGLPTSRGPRSSPRRGARRDVKGRHARFHHRSTGRVDSSPADLIAIAVASGPPSQGLLYTRATCEPSSMWSRRGSCRARTELPRRARKMRGGSRGRRARIEGLQDHYATPAVRTHRNDAASVRPGRAEEARGP